MEARTNEILFQFVCRIVSGELCLTEESDGFAYFPPENLPEPLGPAFRGRLLEWSENPDDTALITDEGASARELLERGLLRRDA